jgi:hypothetical protein
MRFLEEWGFIGYVRVVGQRRLGALLLAACVGCASGKGTAEERRVLVKPGMTYEEVRGALGPPQRTLKLQPAPGIEDQTVEVWSYTYTPGPSAGEVALGIVGAALVDASIAAGGWGGGGGGGGGDSTWRFVVGFGLDGRVRGVTNLEKLP